MIQYAAPTVRPTTAANVSSSDRSWVGVSDLVSEPPKFLSHASSGSGFTDL